MKLRIMFLIASLFLFLQNIDAFADAKKKMYHDLSLEEVNSLVDATNWIVNESCTGTLINADLGIVLTNYHCLEDFIKDGGTKALNSSPKDLFISRNYYQDYSISKQERYSTNIMRIDPILDLAILIIRDKNFKSNMEAKFPPDDYKMTRGEKIYIVGNPEGMDASLEIGNVSALERTVPVYDQETKKIKGVYRYFQIAGGVTGGQSGGAVYNSKGQFIGVTTAASPRASYIGFAIPVDILKDWLTTVGIRYIVDR